MDQGRGFTAREPRGIAVAVSARTRFQSTLTETDCGARSDAIRLVPPDLLFPPLLPDAELDVFQPRTLLFVPEDEPILSTLLSDLSDSLRLRQGHSPSGAVNAAVTHQRWIR